MATPVRKEVQEFQFKLLTQLKLFPSQQSIKLDNPKNLVATASKYGLIFVGHSTGVTCLKTSDVVAIQNQRNNNRGYVTSFPRRELRLNVLPSHVAVSCDNELLAVAVVIENCPILLIYTVTSFGSMKLSAKCDVRMSNTPGVIVRDLQWNPGVPNMISGVLSDGSAVVYELKESSPIISSVPPNSQATCLCWSPKGKQIVIGAKNGSLTQFKPDLKAVKTFAPPQIYNQPEVVSVHWLSNYQFIATYKDRVDTSSKPAVVVVNVPKGAAPSFVNFEDICFGFGTIRPEHYFFHQQQWSVIILGNCNSSEVVVLGQNGDSWEQWLQDESNRAQLPVSEDYQDVYLIGMAIDYSPQAPVPIGENNFINPMPFLLMYSQEGVLCFYHIINLLGNSVALCQVPQPLPDQSGMHLFVDTSNAQQDIKNVVQEESVVNSDAGNKDVPNANQGMQFKIPSFGTDTSLQATSSKEQAPVMSAPSPFSTMGFQKPNQPTSNANQGNILSTGGGFGPVEGSSTGLFSFAPPKSTPLLSQPPPTTPHSAAPLFFQPSVPPPLQPTQPPPTSQVSLSQAESIPPQLMANQSPNNRGLMNTFQTSTPLPSISSQAATIPTSATLTGIQGFATKPALLTTPLKPNSSPITSQPLGMSLPSSKSSFDKPPALPNEMINKVATTKPPDGNIVGSKEPAEVIPTNSAPVKTEVVEVDFIGAMKEEVSNFNTEMKNLDQLKSTLNFSVGHDEINDIASKINDLKIFEKDVQETTQAQEGEVSGLVSSVVEMFSWLENVKTKQKQISNPRYMDLIETQDLDPVTKKHLNNIEQFIYYLETQIKQAHLQLDALWSQHKGTLVKSVELPNLESIYLTILSENYILAAQKVRVTELEVRLKEKFKSFSRKIPNLSEFSVSANKSSSDIELDVLADKLLLSKLNNNDNEIDAFKNNTDRVIMMSTSQKYLNPKKETLLHKWHKNHVVINAKAPKRQSGQVDLSKYSRLITQEEPSASIVSTTVGQVTSAKSIFTITDQARYSSQVLQRSETVSNREELKAGGDPLSSYNSKSDSSKEKQVFGSLSDNAVLNNSTTPAKGSVRVFDAETILQKVPSTSTQEPTSTKNTVAGTNLTNQIPSFNLGISNANVPPKTAFKVDSNLLFKSPPPTTTVSVPVIASSESTSLFSATAVDVTKISPAASNESKETSKKGIGESTSEPRKDSDVDNNQVKTTLPSGAGLTVGSSTSTTTPSFDNQAITSSVGNIFGSSPSSQSTFSSFSFNKAPLFSNIGTASVVSTTGLTTSSIFGTPLVSGSTSSIAPTSIFGAKPLTTTSSFISPVTTSLMPSTTSTSLSISSVTSKQDSTTISTTPATTTTSFFTKPTAMKSLFGSVPIPGANANTSPSLFKISTSLSTSIFASSQPQQLFSTAATVTTSATKSESLVSSSVITSVAVSATPTAVTAVVSPSASNVVSTASSSLTLNTPTVAPEAVSSAVNISVTTVSNLVTSSTPATAVSSSASKVSTVATEKEITSTSSFGTTSPSVSIFGAKTPLQSTPVFDSAVSSPNSLTKTFGTPTAVTAPSAESSIFASAASKPSIFGNQNAPPPFGTNPIATTSSSIFPVATTSVFGSPTTKTTASSIFGTPATFVTSTTSSSVFGAASALASTSFFASPTTSAPAFGAAPTSSIFSPTAATTSSSSSSFFGQPVCSPSTVTNAFSNISFAQKPATVTTASSIFGGNRSSFESKPIFGGAQPGSLFGQTPTTSSPGTFGMSGGSMFGNSSSFSFDSTQQQQPTSNLFQPSPGTGGNIFSSGSPGGGSFSSGNQSVAQSGFGSPPSFQSAPKPFGASGASVFGSQTSFGAPPTFGGSATFGSPNKVFGSPATATGAFGSPNQQSSTFENLAGQNTLTFGNLAQGQTAFTANPSFGVSPPQQPSFPTSPSFGGSSFSTWR